MEYWQGINEGDYYLCDRCQVSKLSADEYHDNVRDIYGSKEKMRYCNECRSYLTLKKWICIECNTQGTIRSERYVPIVHCGENVTWVD